MSRLGALQGLEDIDVAVLAGGLGTRIRAVLGDVPKILAPVSGGRPFLDVLLEWLRGFGARRVVLGLGHLGDRVVGYLERNPAVAAGIEVVPVIEPAPLGTAGAVRFMRPYLTSDPVFILNGDTFVEADVAAFVAGHRAEGCDISLLCAAVESVARFGSVEVDSLGKVRRFVEKDEARQGPGLISAGMYLFSAAQLNFLAAGSGTSLERDVLQAQPPGTIRAETTQGRFIDIGTPDSLAAAQYVIPDTISISGQALFEESQS